MIVARRALLASLLLLGAMAPVARAQSQAQDTTRAPIVVTLITFGIGEQVWERFGHNALWVHDARTGSDIAYNWGLFDFEQPGFLQRFLTGDTKYWMAGENAPAMLDAYRRIGRPITLQRLALSDQQATQLADFLRWNAREENKYYRYDYFRDNCSTRLRDALDLVLHGAIKRATSGTPLLTSYRRESVRLTEGDAPVQAGIDIALGRPADAPLSEWDTFFIPMQLRDGLRGIQVMDEQGAPRPLVADERTIAPLASAPHVVEAEVSPRLAPRYLAVGLVLALVISVLRVMAVSRRSFAWALALVGASWSLLCGVLGLLVLMAWLATRHVFWSWNENLLLLTPLSLVLVALIPSAILSGRGTTAARTIAAAVVASGLFAALLALLPGGQESRAIVALFLPVHVAVALALALPRDAVRIAPPMPATERTV